MNKKGRSFRFTAKIHRLSIQKNIQFDCKIIWKRHSNKTETKIVKHAHGFSTFDESIYLDINMVPQFESQSLTKYKQKNTQFVVLITTNDKIKSGGYAKYDVSQLIGITYKQETLKLSQCPDSQAYIQMTLSAQQLEQNLIANQSVLNASSRDLNYSRLEIHEKTKATLQMQKINLILDNFQQLGQQIKDRVTQKKSNIPQIAQKQKKIQILEGQNKTLQQQLNKSQNKVEKQNQQFKQQKKQLMKQIKDLQKQLQKKNSKSSNDIGNITDNSVPIPTKNNKDKKDYKDLYQKAMQQIQQLKELAMKNSLGKLQGSFDDFMNKKYRQLDQEHQVDDQQDQQQNQNGNNRNNYHNNQKVKTLSEEQLRKLQKENSQLQNNVATLSHKLATLFNASLNYGGQELVDYLQTSIGIIQ